MMYNRSQHEEGDSYGKTQHKQKELFLEVNAMCDEAMGFCKGYNPQKAMEEFTKAVLETRSDAYISNGYSPMLYYLTKHGKLQGNDWRYAASLYQCWCWNRSKIFFSFDEELEKEIRDSDISLSSQIPASLLNRCPYSSFFIQTRGGVRAAEGLESVMDRESFADNGIGFFVNISPQYKLDRKHGVFVRTGSKILDTVWCTYSKFGDSPCVYEATLLIPPEGTEETIEECYVECYSFSPVLQSFNRLTLILTRYSSADSMEQVSLSAH